ncbi:MAG: FG-GAP repeat protein [Thiotrichales bacterium]|nr:MAG: FG-GAP repeat protein [Thiotrichales bacterium]
MRVSKPVQLVFILLAWLLLSGRSCTETTITTGVETAQKISDTAGNFEGILEDNDRFGSAVANAGDLERDGVIDLAVGTPLDDDGGTDRGAVWILFMNDDGTVDIEQKISDTEGNLPLTTILDDNDRFGSAVAELGDLNGDGFLDIAVGAPLDDDGGTDRGAVWILFLNDDGTVQSTQKIADSRISLIDILEDNDQFGGAIANIGDLNNDRIDEIAVGASLSDDGGGDRGAIWILFLARDGTVISGQKVSDTDGGFSGTLDDGDFFGSSIAGIGDLDADGIEDIAVGAIGDDDGGADRGAVWILFMNADGTVRFEQKLSETSGNFNGGLNDNDHFGSALTGIGDYNGDGIVDIAAGAEQDDDGGSDRGAVWILFMESDGEILSKQKISSTSGNFTGPLSDGVLFGSALANPGDLDQDGIIDIVAGAKLDDDGGIDRGALWTLFMQRPETDIDITLFDNRE